MKDWRWAAFMIPGSFLVVFLGIPLLKLFIVALSEKEATSAVAHFYFQPLYIRAFFNTLFISASVALACALFGAPTAYLLALSSPRRARLIFAIATASMWLSVLVRSYAWTVLLQKTGPLSMFLQLVGILDGPKSFLFTRGSVILGMCHILLPYMILIIWASIARDGGDLRQLAYILGASPWFYVSKVLLRQSIGGIVGGVVIVFILSLGFYITPELLGGGRGETMMMGVLIDQQVNSFGKWRSGGVLSLYLIGFVGLLWSITWSTSLFRHLLEEPEPRGAGDA